MTRPTALPPSGAEIALDAAELIYTRTDERGIIRAANPVFQRLAGYSWDELLGSPHRLVRHPDMPKGFFHIFWEQLKAGEPAVGYVKNLSRDGRHYWVLANAIACDGGYFSVRMKPAGPLFETLRNEYAALLRREQAEGLSAEQSAQILKERLAALGFPSYMDFMSQAISDEVGARGKLLGRTQDRESHAISALIGLLTQAQETQNRLVAQFTDLMLLPVNMRLVAARLEPQGGPISQISMNYKTASDEIANRLSSFVSGEANLCGKMSRAVRRSLVLGNCARLQSELVAAYDRSVPRHEGPERRMEGRILVEVEKLCIARAQEAISQAERLASDLSDGSNDLRRMILGLDTIRILGRVESRRDLASEAAMSATIDRIDHVQGEISKSLKDLNDLTSSIHAQVLQLQRPDPAEMAAE